MSSDGWSIFNSLKKFILAIYRILIRGAFSKITGSLENDLKMTLLSNNYDEKATFY